LGSRRLFSGVSRSVHLRRVPPFKRAIAAVTTIMIMMTITALVLVYPMFTVYALHFEG
jgi:hypothetical protein